MRKLLTFLVLLLSSAAHAQTPYPLTSPIGGIAAGTVTNTMLANPGLTLGSTALTLGATTTSIAGLTLTASPNLALRDTSAAFDVTLGATSSTPLGAGRTITFDAVNGSRTLKFGSNLSIATDPGAVSGAMKSNGTGTFTQAACADLSNAVATCSSADAAGLTGTLAAARLPALTGDATSSAGSAATTVGKINGTACDAGFTLGPYGCTWSQPAANSASLDYTGLVGGNYRLQCAAMLMANNATSFIIQLGEGGTPTYQTSSYTSAGYLFTAAASGIVTGITTAGLLISDSVANSGNGLNSDTVLFGLSSSIIHMQVNRMTFVNSAGTFSNEVTGGEYTGDTNPITAIRVKAVSGNLTSGTCTLMRMS